MSYSWLGLSCSLLQKLSHRHTGVLNANCVLVLHNALMILSMSGDSPAVAKCRTKFKLAAVRQSRSQIVNCKFVSGSRNRCWWAGINSGVFPVFTNHTNCGNHGCVYQQGTITKAAAQPWAGSVSTFPTILNGEWIYESRSKLCREKTFIWYTSGSGVYDAYLVHLVFMRLAKQIYFWFPKLFRKGLRNPLV